MAPKVPIESSSRITGGWLSSPHDPAQPKASLEMAVARCVLSTKRSTAGSLLNDQVNRGHAHVADARHADYG